MITRDASVGGIVRMVRVAEMGTFENCLSCGKIKINSTMSYIGAVVGNLNSAARITHCLWAEGMELGQAYGYNRSSVAMENSFAVTPNVSTANELNEYPGRNTTWSKWFVVHPNGGSINGIAYEMLVVTQKSFPKPLKEGHTLLFWCKGIECNEIYEPKTSNESEVSELFAVWAVSNFTASFDFDNGTVVKEAFMYNETIRYPTDVAREGYTFVGWNISTVRMPAEDIAAKALWVRTASEYVEVMIGKKGLTEEEIKKIIEEFTDEDVIIESFEEDEATGETRVIIKFVDNEKANEFVRNVLVRTRDSSSDILIRKVDKVEVLPSFSVNVVPALVVALLAWP